MPMWKSFISRTFPGLGAFPAPRQALPAMLLAASVLGGCTANPVAGPAADAPADPESRLENPVAGQGNPLPPPDVDERTVAEFEEAVALMREESYSDAEVLLLAITREAPELAGPWINLGQVYVALNQPEEARRAFEAAAAANPYNCAAHNELGLLSRIQGDFEAAERHYLNCLERVPGDSTAHLNLGILYELYLGRLNDALANYRSYLTLLEEPDKRVRGWVMDLERRLGV